MTVLQLVKKYVGQKTGVRHNTEANYNFIINIINMGHSDIEVSLNTYTHVGFTDVQKEMKRVYQAPK